MKHDLKKKNQHLKKNKRKKTKNQYKTGVMM